MNPSYFTDATVTMSQPLQGLTQVPNQNNKGSLHDLKVNDLEIQMLIGQIFNHLQIEPPQGLRQQAEFLMQQMTNDQIYAVAQQEYMQRSHAYMNGSVLERVKRFFGGHPMPPMHPNQMQAMQMQAMYQQPMYGQPMPQQPIGYVQPQQMMTPPPAPQPDMMQNMQEQVNNLTMIVQQLAQDLNKGTNQ